MQHQHAICKVIAHITRQHDSRQQLLVFTHRDYPEAGLQVPAGTVKPGEDIEVALAREIAEETGLNEFTIRGKLAPYLWLDAEGHNLHERHVFHVTVPDHTPDARQWVEIGRGEVPQSEAYVFQFH